MTSPTYSELVAQVQALQQPTTLADLPLKSLGEWLETDWQPDANLLLPPGGIGADLLAPDVVPVAVRGGVTSAGAVSFGSGFAVVRNSAGNYTVTYTTPFLVAAAVLALPLDPVNWRSVQLIAQSATAFTAQTFNSSFAAADAAFNFQAVSV